MPKDEITAVVLAKNEEEYLPRCLKSIFWVNEIIIIGDEPTPKIMAIASKFNARVYLRKLDNFCDQRNFALEKVKTPWVLLVDPDEEVSMDLAQEIQQSVRNGVYEAYKFPRKNIIFGKWIEHSGWFPDWQTHLFKVGKGKYVGKIHEQVEIEGEVGNLKNPLIHNNYQNLSQYLEKNYRYTSLEAEKQMDNGYLFSWKDLIRKPSSEFLRRFFAEEGYLDGVHGLALCLLQSFMELLVYLKIWEKTGFKAENTPQVFKEMDQSLKEVDYWVTLKTKNPFRKILNKFR